MHEIYFINQAKYFADMNDFCALFHFKLKHNQRINILTIDGATSKTTTFFITLYSYVIYQKLLNNIDICKLIFFKWYNFIRNELTNIFLCITYKHITNIYNLMIYKFLYAILLQLYVSCVRTVKFRESSGLCMNCGL